MKYTGQLSGRSDCSLELGGLRTASLGDKAKAAKIKRGIRCLGMILVSGRGMCQVEREQGAEVKKDSSVNTSP